MKIFKTVCIWVFISITIQVMALLFAEKVIFKPKNQENIEITKVEKVKEKSIEIDIPSDAKDIKINNKGTYLSYRVNQDLFIASTKDGKITMYDQKDGNKPRYAYWLPNSDNMHVFANASKPVDKRGREEKGTYIFKYSARKELVNWELREYGSNKNFPLNFDIKDATMADASGMEYIRAKVGDIDKVYTFDRTGMLRAADNIVVDKISSMKAAKGLADLTYMSVKDKRTIYFQVDPKKTVKFDKDVILLESIKENKEEDRLYVGVLEGDKIVEILHGVRSQNTKNWESVKLSKPTSINDVYIAIGNKEKGRIYVNDNLTAKVKDYSTNKEFNYEGKFISFYDEGVLSLNSEGKAMKNNFVLDEKKENDTNNKKK